MWEGPNAYLGYRKALIQGKGNFISRRYRVCTVKVFGAQGKKETLLLARGKRFASEK